MAKFFNELRVAKDLILNGKELENKMLDICKSAQGMSLREVVDLIKDDYPSICDLLLFAVAEKKAKTNKDFKDLARVLDVAKKYIKIEIVDEDDF